MNRYIRSAVIGIGLAMLMPFCVYAMTVTELKTAYPAAFTAGNQSVYGPSLNQGQLDSVAQGVSDFVNQYITADMSEEQKIRTIHTYLFQNISYAESWSRNSANTAFGALVNHTAQCSGYARAFKAMCDAVGIECYYVQADDKAFNPNHQWNIVKYDGQYYHMDVQENSLGKGGDSTYLSAAHVCSYNLGDYPQVAAEDAPVQRYYDGTGPYAAAVQSAVVYDFPEKENIRMDIPSREDGPVGEVNYGVCTAVQLPEDAGSIVIQTDSPYDESRYHLQMAIIPYKGQDSREKNALCLALEDNYLRNFQYLKKGEAASLDPLGTGRSGPEIAQYCRENDIFFELVIFDENAYRKFEQEHGSVTIDNLVRDIPNMHVWLTY